MKKIALIFAGGTGQRMGADIPKQFLKVHGKEIIIHTLELFEINDEIDEIYVACLDSWINELKKLVKKYTMTKVKKIFPGGVTGQDTIYIGLNTINKDYEDAIVLIHDGVRPLVNQETINKCIKITKKKGNAITVSECYETPIVSNNGDVVERMLPRKTVYTAQAPQCFFLRDILRIHNLERKDNPHYDGIVDSCGLMFKHKIKCNMIIGNRGNIKVTTPSDYCTLLGNYTAEDYKQLLYLTETK